MFHERQNGFLGILLAIPIILIALFVIIYLFVASPFKITTGSLAPPDYTQGQYVLASKITYRFKKPAWGDYIIYRLPTNDAYHIGRIDGIPGDRIEVIGNKVILYNQSKQKLYTMNIGNRNFVSDIKEGETLTIPAGHFAILGSNRTNGVDSLELGFVLQSQIIAKIGF